MCCSKGECLCFCDSLKSVYDDHEAVMRQISGMLKVETRLELRVAGDVSKLAAAIEAVVVVHGVLSETSWKMQRRQRRTVAKAILKVARFLSEAVGKRKSGQLIAVVEAGVEGRYFLPEAVRKRQG